MTDTPAPKPQPLTREDIWEAADALDAAGKRPTLEAVRKVLGRGSYSTIQPALTEWKARQTAQGAAVREPAPASLAERIKELGDEIWTSALDLANARLESERIALDAARVELDEARQEAAELADALTSELDAERDRTTRLGQQVTHAQTELQTLRERLAVAESRNEDLQRQVDAERQSAETAREAMATAREESATLRGQVDMLTQQQQQLIEKLGSSPKGRKE